MRICNNSGDVRVFYILGDCDLYAGWSSLNVFEIEHGETKDCSLYPVFEEPNNLIDPGMYHVKQSDVKDFISGKIKDAIETDLI